MKNIIVQHVYSYSLYNSSSLGDFFMDFAELYLMICSFTVYRFIDSLRVGNIFYDRKCFEILTKLDISVTLCG